MFKKRRSDPGEIFGTTSRKKCRQIFGYVGVSFVIHLKGDRPFFGTRTGKTTSIVILLTKPTFLFSWILHDGNKRKLVYRYAAIHKSICPQMYVPRTKNINNTVMNIRIAALYNTCRLCSRMNTSVTSMDSVPITCAKIPSWATRVIRPKRLLISRYVFVGNIFTNTFSPTRYYCLAVPFRGFLKFIEQRHTFLVVTLDNIIFDYRTAVDGTNGIEKRA